MISRWIFRRIKYPSPSTEYTKERRGIKYMKTASENLYYLIVNSKVEVVSVTEKCRNGICHPVCEGIPHPMTTYRFVKNLEHLVKSDVFCNLSWEYKLQSESIILESDALQCGCDTYLEVEIVPIGDTGMQQIIEDLENIIFSTPVFRKKLFDHE